MPATGEVMSGRKRRGILLVLVLFAAGGGVTLWWRTQAPVVPIVAITEPPAVRHIKALGEVLPGSNLVVIAAPTGQEAGRIAQIDVREGDAVAAETVLAVLDSEPLLRALLDQAIANEAVKRSALAVRIADLEAAEKQLLAQVSAQQVAQEKAQVELSRRTRLRDTGLYEDAALKDMQLNVESAALTLQNLQIQLDRSRMRSATGSRLDVDSAQAELASAAAARSKAEADYAKAFIRAPIAGRVLALFGRVGQQIDSAGFGEIGDTAQMMIRAEVYETDMAGVFNGQEAEARSRALAQPLHGTVSRLGVRLSAQSILSTDPAAVVDARVIEVWIALDAASSALVADRSGLQVTVAFAPKESGDA